MQLGTNAQWLFSLQVPAVGRLGKLVVPKEAAEFQGGGTAIVTARIIVLTTFQLLFGAAAPLCAPDAQQDRRVLPGGTLRAISPAPGFGNQQLDVLGRHGELLHSKEREQH